MYKCIIVIDKTVNKMYKDIMWKSYVYVRLRNVYRDSIGVRIDSASVFVF